MSLDEMVLRNEHSKGTVDAPLTDHTWQFSWYFSYLFELNIWHFIFQKFCFYAI